MKRPSFLLLLGFVIAMVFLGCLSGPGVEPPRATNDNETDQAGSSGAIPATTGTGGASTQSENTTGGSTAITSGTGGAGGAILMDASIADGGPSMDSGSVSDSAVGDAGIGPDDDAGSEQ